MSKHSACLVILACACPSISLGQSSDVDSETTTKAEERQPSTLVYDADPRRFSFFLENDVLLFGARNEDRNYTMGVVLEGGGRWIHDTKLDAPLEWVNQLVRFSGHTREAPCILSATSTDHACALHSVRLGVSAFTPEDIPEPDPIFDDRPYASLLYLSVRNVQPINRRFKPSEPVERRAYASELSLGVLGLGIAEEFQSWLHERLRDWRNKDKPAEPQGWGHQVSDGGELTAKYMVGRKELLWPRAALRTSPLELQWVAEGNIGYYTNANVSATVRWGKIRSPWWEFEGRPITVTSVLLASNSGNVKVPAESSNEYYLWASLRGTAWLYNALLEGQFKQSDVTVNADDIERFVGDYIVGATARRGNHSLSYAVSARSPEFEGPNRRSHAWAGIFYTYACTPHPPVR